jgi:3-oxoadipate enol-lactonase
VPFATVGDGRLYWEESGTGPPLLLIASLGRDLSMWGVLLPALAAHHRVVRYDQRDVGCSSRCQAPYAVPDLAQDAAGLLDRLSIAHAHVLGVSTGGTVAQELALAEPERVRSLVLCASWPATAPLRETVPVFRRTERAAQIRSVMASVALTQPPEAFVRQAQAAREHDARGRLPALEVPTLVVEAAEDEVVPPRHSRELAALIPNARLARIADCGHEIERSERLAPLVLDFLASFRPSGSSAAGRAG